MVDAVSRKEVLLERKTTTGFTGVDWPFEQMISILVALILTGLNAFQLAFIGFSWSTLFGTIFCALLAVALFALHRVARRPDTDGGRTLLPTHAPHLAGRYFILDVTEVTGLASFAGGKEKRDANLSRAPSETFRTRPRPVSDLR